MRENRNRSAHADDGLFRRGANVLSPRQWRVVRSRYRCALLSEDQAFSRGDSRELVEAGNQLTLRSVP